MRKNLLFFVSILAATNALGQTIPVYVPAQGLMAWYPFSGNANDLSGNGHDGTVSGAALTADRLGNANSAYQFDGNSTSISTDLQGPTGNSARTISCWLKYDGFPNPCNTQGVLAGYGATDAGCWQATKNFSLEVNRPGGAPSGWVDGVCIATYQTNDTLDENWHFMSAIYDSSFGNFHNIKIYIDGQYKSTSTVQYNPSPDVNTDTLSRLLIGAGHYACQRFFDGKIDDIAVWNRALFENELYDLYRGDPYAHSDSMLVYVDNLCSNMQFTLSPVNYNSGLSIKTWFGDGQTQTDSFSTASHLARFDHIYNYTGNYTVKHIIYDGLSAVDSVIYTYNYEYCRVLPIRFFADINSNCNFDTPVEPFIFQPTTVEVDSASVPVDTIAITSGLDYYAYGPEGTVYTFKVISTVAGLTVSCPANGTINDTLSMSNNTTKNFALQCTGTPGYDLQLYVTSIAGHHHFHTAIIAMNALCTPPNATLTMHMSPKYTGVQSFWPSPSNATGNDISWDFNGLSSILSNPVAVYADMEGAGTVGDTVLQKYDITPTIGDANPVDNVIIHCDTITGSYDPNFIAANPSGCIQPDVTRMEYAVHFENTGNDTAFNITVLDTLSDNLDPASLKVMAATATMITSVITPGGHNVLKFDFPHINLLDSSYHGLCDGMFVYSIGIKDGLTDGTYIANRAGIYFDDNEVVLTNTATNRIGCPTSVTNVRQSNSVRIYPNPTGNQFIITTDDNNFSSFTLTDVLGSTVLQQALQPKQTKVDIRNLPAGVYYLTLHSGDASLVRKVIKL